MPVSNTVTGFRQAVLGRRGPQIAAKYKVRLQSPVGTIEAYPLSVILPGRNFLFYDHDIWGPVRKIPFKRGYTQCNMSFIIYQDWRERRFLEAWMNRIVINSSAILNNANLATVDPNFNSIGDGTDPDGLGIADIETGGLISRLDNQDGSPRSANNYSDWVNYNQVRFQGHIEIECLRSENHNSANVTFQLKEAYPAQITPVALGSDGTGYPSFTVSFQFNSYTVG